MATEIERKFLVADVPHDDVLGPGVPMRQGYLAGEGDVESRIRITPGGARLTVKAGRGVARTEVELDVPVDEAEALWPHTEGRRREKVRHRVVVPGGTAEVDRYAGPLDGLWTVEVEFASEADASAFVAPAWFGDELTTLDGWSNGALARHGRPDR
ncbi:MAG: adenylate cyclase [Ilumatobacteraceae bacterium]